MSQITPLNNSKNDLTSHKGNIAQGLKTWEQQHNVWALEKRIEESEDIPDSYKRFYIEEVKRDYVGTMAKIQKIEEEARDARLKEIDKATPISVPTLKSNPQVSHDSEKTAETVISAPEVLPPHDRTEENLTHDQILTNSDKNAAIVGQVETPGVAPALQQTLPKGEGQERQDDQAKVMAQEDRTEIATSNAASSTQEPATHAPGVEFVKSATETASIESQVEATPEKTPAVLSPKAQEGYLKIRQYVRREGEPEELVVFEQHYKADPDHAIAFRKSLLSGDKDFKIHMAKPYVPDALVKEMTSAIASNEISNLKKPEALIQKIQQLEYVSSNVEKTLQTRREARDQLKDLYTQASQQAVVMDRLKQNDPKMHARVQDHVESEKSRSWGLEI